ncbi:MAG TPA: L-threonylcarbamoyladenylate synthase [Terriglobia bacterium]|nr:L-threonylcarbamoyladenylate synthase [Terriglobia bacterium]
MAQILQVDPVAPQPERIALAADCLRRGEVIGIPTDTLYGLAADPFQPAAVERIFAVKGRSPDAPVLLLVDSLEMAGSVAKHLPEAFHLLARRYWPGPLTVVVEAVERLPAIVTGGTGRVGLRLPAAAIPRELSRAFGGPITGTSANRSGQPPCQSAPELEACLGRELPLILDAGPSPSAVPSTVVGVWEKSWHLIREGAIRENELEDFLSAHFVRKELPSLHTETSG